MTTCELGQLDAAYVLGALSPADREAFAAHLPECASCTRAVRELAGIPGLLAQVDPADLAAQAHPPVPAPPMLLARVVRTARDEQRRITRRTAAVAAAVALTLGAGGSWALATRGDHTEAAAPSPSVTASNPAARPRAMTQVGQEVVVASVATVPVAWGTRLDLECTWAAEAAESAEGSGWADESDGNAAYALVVRTKDGHREQVATWRALPGRTMHLSGATASDLDDIAAVEVQTASGQVVLQATI